MRVITLLLGLLLVLPNVAFGQEVAECDGPYKGKRLTDEELVQVLARHKEWFNNRDSGNSDRHPANLCGAILSGANLSNAFLFDAMLSNADLSDANLSDANLFHVNLSNAALFNANLSGAKMLDANLSGTKLNFANLSGAFLRDANMADSVLSGAILSNTFYEPKDGISPKLYSIAEAKGLHELKYGRTLGLAMLRKLFKDGGYRYQERQITYAIHHSRTKKLLGRSNDLLGRIEGAFNYVLFELTTKWGMEPSRALMAICVLILVFTLPYAYAVRAPKNDGIWRFWVEERARTDLGSKAPELLRATGIHVITLSLYFSFLSAFHIGWRDLNVGNWITRVQPREYTLRASGWVRTVSGIQSLLSVYLLAIWALTYFGRPFE